MNMIIYTWLFSLLVCLKKKRWHKTHVFTAFFPVTWMQQHRQIKLKITPVIHTGSLLPRPTAYRLKHTTKNHTEEKEITIAVFVFIVIPSTWLQTLHFSSRVSFLASEKERKKKTLWLFNFKNFSFCSWRFFVCFPSFMLRNLIGQLEDWHFRRSPLVLSSGRRVKSPSLASPRGATASWREATGCFIPSVRL